MKSKTVANHIAIALILFLGFSVKGIAQSQEIIIQTTAQCGECETIIEKALLAQKGVRFADLDVETKKVKVVYNSKKITPEQLRSTISMVGYDADDVPANAEAVKKLNPCCTKDGHRED